MTAKRRFKVSRSNGSGLLVAVSLITALGGCGSPGKSIAGPEAETQVPSSKSAVSVGGITLSKSKVPDGGLLVIRAKSSVEPIAEFEGVSVSFYPVPDRGPQHYEALLAVPFDHKPGKTSLDIRMGDTVTAVPFEIVDGGYPSEKLTVSKRHVNPKKKDLERINRERAEIGKIYAQISKERMWNKAFTLPIPSVVTSQFGTKRVFNGQMQSFHQGIDLRAPIGTPIVAPASGRIVLAKDLFYTGHTLLIDHGYGLVSLYAHMSKLEVKLGDKVEAGQRLGLSGMTGRANGPHLHWGLVLGKLKVNPLDLVEGY